MSLDITAASALYLLMWWLHHNKHYQWSPQHRLAADTRTRSSSWYQIAHRTLSTGAGNEGPLVGSQSWKRPLLEAATTAFTFETQLTHIMLNGRALRVKTQLVDMKLGSWCEGHKGQAALRHYANQPVVAAFNQEKAIVGTISVIANLRVNLRFQVCCPHPPLLHHPSLAHFIFQPWQVLGSASTFISGPGLRINQKI